MGGTPLAPRGSTSFALRLPPSLPRPHWLRAIPLQPTTPAGSTLLQICKLPATGWQPPYPDAQPYHFPLRNLSVDTPFSSIVLFPHPPIPLLPLETGSTLYGPCPIIGLDAPAFAPMVGGTDLPLSQLDLLSVASASPLPASLQSRPKSTRPSLPGSAFVWSSTCCSRPLSPTD